MGFFDIVTSPVTSVANTLNNAWNDFTGKTATEMSIKASKQNTAQQLAWERERATNAHQWEVEDLEKAGLNPILSAGGSGAQTSGITPQMPDTSQYKGAGGALISLMNIANQAQALKINSATAKANIDNLNAKTGLTKIQELTEKYKHGLINAEQALKEAQTTISKLDAEHYQEMFDNKISYNLPGVTKALNKWLTKTLAEYGVTPESAYNYGKNAFDEQIKDGLNLINKYNKLKKAWNKYENFVDKGNKWFKDNFKIPNWKKIKWYN